MSLPWERWMTTKFRSSSQLAHLSARQVHELQHHIREAHREWEEVKTLLRQIRELAGSLPDENHHEAIGQVFQYIDAFTDIEKRYDKRLAHLRDHVEKLKEHLEREKKESRRSH